MTSRPDRVFDPAVQHERTALAWERTGVALMVGGGLLLKHAIDSTTTWAEVLGLLVGATGAGILLWSSHRYESLHGVLRSDSDVTHPSMLRAVALVTVAVSAGALLLLIVRAAR
jgi:putative membrane protein